MLLNCLKSDWIKLKRTSLRRIIPTFFFVYTIFIIWYSGSHIAQSNNVNYPLYKIFFEPIGILLPIILSVYIAILSVLEKNAGNFKNVTGSPFGKTKAFISKNLLVSLILVFSMLLSIFVFIIGVKLFYGFSLSYKIFLVGAIITCVSCVSLISIFLVISLYCSTSALVALGFFSTLVTVILSVTSLGSMVWWIIPFTYPALLPLLAIYADFYQCLPVCIICLVITVLSFILSSYFLKRFEK